MPAEEFERRIGDVLRSRFPFSVLSNVCVFKPDTKEDYLFTNQIDHLLHFETEEEDVLVVVECKAQTLRNNRGGVPDRRAGWYAHYGQGESEQSRDVKAQVRNQVTALRHLLMLHKEARACRFEVWVVHTGETVFVEALRDPTGSDLYLLNPELLAEPFSDFDSPGQPVPIQRSRFLLPLSANRSDNSLFHPPILDAIAFVDRSRMILDREIFSKLRFSKYRSNWCIQGTAGSGKSVLLAYAVAALSTGLMIELDEDGGRKVEGIDDLTPWGFPSRADLKIRVFAMTEFQVKTLVAYWNRFVDDLAALGNGGRPAICPLRFDVWDGTAPTDCNVLVIDECHDLSSSSQRTLANWLNACPNGRYLIVACDRHQQLQEHGAGTRIIDGLNFALKCTALTRSYRSPVSVFMVATGLLFRWFASSGPKVRPGVVSLRAGSSRTLEVFSGISGIKIGNLPAGKTRQCLVMRNDSHPGNSWRRTVDLFDDPIQLDWFLRSNGLGKKQVLWLRFSQQNDRLANLTLGERYNFHAVDPFNPAAFIDGNIKGLEFPVVVIEGSPQPFNLAAFGEDAMWKCRRQLYLCITRASGFVYFALQDSDENRALREELMVVLHCLENPCQREFEPGHTWMVTFNWGDEVRTMDDYLDAIQAEEELVEEGVKPIAAWEDGDDIPF